MRFTGPVHSRGDKFLEGLARTLLGEAEARRKRLGLPLIAMKRRLPNGQTIKVLTSKAVKKVWLTPIGGEEGEEENLAAFLLLPVSDDCPDGWGEPFDEPLGTCGGPDPRMILIPQNAAYRLIKPTTITAGNIDWRNADAVNAEILTWAGPFTRGFIKSAADYGSSIVYKEDEQEAGLDVLGAAFRSDPEIGRRMICACIGSTAIVIQAKAISDETWTELLTVRLDEVLPEIGGWINEYPNTPAYWNASGTVCSLVREFFEDAPVDPNLARHWAHVKITVPNDGSDPSWEIAEKTQIISHEWANWTGHETEKTEWDTPSTIGPWEEYTWIEDTGYDRTHNFTIQGEQLICVDYIGDVECKVYGTVDQVETTRTIKTKIRPDYFAGERLRGVEVEKYWITSAHCLGDPDLFFDSLAEAEAYLNANLGDCPGTGWGAIYLVDEQFPPVGWEEWEIERKRLERSNGLELQKWTIWGRREFELTPPGGYFRYTTFPSEKEPYWSSCRHDGITWTYDIAKTVTNEQKLKIVHTSEDPEIPPVTTEWLLASAPATRTMDRDYADTCTGFTYTESDIETGTEEFLLQLSYVDARAPLALWLSRTQGITENTSGSGTTSPVSISMTRTETDKTRDYKRNGLTGELTFKTTLLEAGSTEVFPGSRNVDSDLFIEYNSNGSSDNGFGVVEFNGTLNSFAAPDQFINWLSETVILSTGFVYAADRTPDTHHLSMTEDGVSIDIETLLGLHGNNPRMTEVNVFRLVR